MPDSPRAAATKAEAKARLQAKNLWIPFFRYRDSLKIEGTKPALAHKLATEAFFPDGPLTDPTLPADAAQFCTPTDGQTSRDVSSPDPGPGQPSDIPTQSPSDSTPTLASSLPATKSIGRVPGKEFEGKTCGRAQVVDWVAKHLAIGDVSPEDAPSAEAWAMLTWVQRSYLNETDFWKSIYRALLPNKTELEAEGRFSDDGRGILRIISSVEKACQEAVEEQPPSA